MLQKKHNTKKSKTMSARLSVEYILTSEDEKFVCLFLVGFTVFIGFIEQ